jgi:hypothetical protein
MLNKILFLGATWFFILEILFLGSIAGTVGNETPFFLWTYGWADIKFPLLLPDLTIPGHPGRTGPAGYTTISGEPNQCVNE